MMKEINPYFIKDLKKIHSIMTFLNGQKSREFRKGNEGFFD